MGAESAPPWCPGIFPKASTIRAKQFTLLIIFDINRDKTNCINVLKICLSESESESQDTPSSSKPGWLRHLNLYHVGVVGHSIIRINSQILQLNPYPRSNLLSNILGGSKRYNLPPQSCYIWNSPEQGSWFCQNMIRDHNIDTTNGALLQTIRQMFLKGLFFSANLSIFHEMFGTLSQS